MCEILRRTRARGSLSGTRFRRNMACINSAARALLISGQCGHSGSKKQEFKKSCATLSLDSQGLGQTGQSKNQTEHCRSACFANIWLSRERQMQHYHLRCTHRENKARWEQNWFSGQT